MLNTAQNLFCPFILICQDFGVKKKNVPHFSVVSFPSLVFIIVCSQLCIRLKPPFLLFVFHGTETMNWKNVVLVLGRRRLPQDEHQSGECVAFGGGVGFVSAGLTPVFALRRRVGADAVERNAAHGGQRPEETLREERADRSPAERAAALGLSDTRLPYVFYPPGDSVLVPFVFPHLSKLSARNAARNDCLIIIFYD